MEYKIELSILSESFFRFLDGRGGVETLFLKTGEIFSKSLGYEKKGRDSIVLGI